MRKEEQAFTLLEIMLVVTIIALLLAAAIKFMAPNVDIAKRVRVTGDIQAIKTSLLPPTRESTDFIRQPNKACRLW